MTASEKDFSEDRVISEDNEVLFSRATLYRRLDAGSALQKEGVRRGNNERN